MSGLEPVIVAKAAASVAGRIATSVGMKLAKSRILRWRVRRRVAKAVEFDIPGRQYMNWLKQINVPALSEPIESAGPRLAQSLDSHLSANASWIAASDRHSRALALVKQTYLAMEAVSDDADARTLSSSWAEARHQEMIAKLAELVGPAVELNRTDIGDLLVRRSEARRAVRLASFGIEPEAVGPAFATYQRHVPKVEPGAAVVLVGPYGSGKSELAELWFRMAVDEFRQDESAHQPMWFHASELASRSIDDEIFRRLGVPAGSSSTLALVIDGLDEVDSSTAARVVAQAQVLVRVAAHTRVLLTCRPGVLPSYDWQVQHDGIERDEAVAIIEAIAGSARAAWQWDPTLIDAIKRPFFALAAGVMINEGKRPTGQADLIARLVTRALSTPSGSSSAVRDLQTFDLLTRLAISETKSGGGQDGLSFQERQRALSSTLVHEVGGHVEFSLPIFQQWFASTGILADSSLVSLAVSDAESFDRWRWALAIACLGSSSEQLDDILATCLAANPGAGSWILARIADGHRGFREPDGDDIDTATAGHRLLRATRIWIDSIGDLSIPIFPINKPSQPIGLGVRVAGNMVSTGWLRKVPEADTLIDLPPHVHPFAPPDNVWWPDRSGTVAEGDEWPWMLVRERIARNVLKILDNEPLIGGVGGVWQTESRYRALRIVLQDRSVLYPPIDRDRALGVVEQNLASVPDSDLASWTFAGFGTIRGWQMADLADWLTQHRGPTIVRPLPAPDREYPPRGMVWGWYSDDQLRLFCGEMLGNGCMAYDEAARGMFSKFSWSLGTAQPGLFGVLAELSFQTESLRGRMPVLNTMILPNEILQDEIISWGVDFELSGNGRAAVALASDATQSHRHFQERAEELFRELGPNLAGNGPFRQGFGCSQSMVSEVIHPRPASLVAAKWIWNDLKRLDLTHGTFPQLRN